MIMEIGFELRNNSGGQKYKQKIGDICSTTLSPDVYREQALVQPIVRLIVKQPRWGCF